MFRIFDGRDSFFQWDLNRRLIVEDNSINEVHFSNKTDDSSLVCVVRTEDGLRVADVPNILLQTDWSIRAYAYCTDHTIVEEIFKVHSRNKPADYIYTETEIKNYDDLKARVDEIERVAADIPTVDSTLTQSGQAADAAVVGNRFAALSEEIAAIPSGKDGADGKSAYQYAVDGGYTGTETEFSTKLAQEKFANPNALTFTGAVTGSYDGSAPLEVAIPSGGDAGKRVRHIATVSVTAGITSYNVTVDSNGDALNLESVYILTNNFWGNNGSYVQVSINGRELTRAYGASGSPQALALEKMGELQKFTNIPKPSNVGISFGDYYNGKSAVTSVGFWSAGSTLDTTIEIYGVDA